MYEEIRVKTVLNDVYREHGCNPFHKGGHSDPNSLSTMELTARRKAFNALETSDRMALNRMVDAICEKTGFGTDSALSLLMRMGIFFDACAKRIR